VEIKTAYLILFYTHGVYMFLLFFYLYLLYHELSNNKTLKTLTKSFVL